MYDIDISVCPTRWASFQTAFELLSKCIPSNMLVDMKIVQFITVKHSCREIGSKFSIQYLENYDQISRQLKQPSIIKNAHDYLDHSSSNGKTDMLPYLKAVWKNNEYMVGLLSIFETLTVSNGSVERLFSFYHRQISHFLRRNLDYKTLDAMAYIYVEKITNNINHIYTDDDENDEYE
ncbi:Hypothetical_protein [Hexamita inflata]|uniref:Hypothetical_protein n=1 Tax=Hexamita inflata TaxID=28002 RepID=A0AA86U511_9EUKA|nr:Hypothetical protein HINF_LOCUS27331 [Hexamita inflata]